MRVADYILNVLAERGISDVFGITGGAITPIFDAFSGRSDIRHICVHHEQAAAMAAEAYARMRGLGACIATSGPGASNLLTGLGCAWFDSIPVVAITGNVNTWESRTGTRSEARQVGFQEMDIVRMAEPITKMATRIGNFEDVRYKLEKALYVAKSGRPGPVLIDLPFDIQRMEIDPDKQFPFTPMRERINDKYIQQSVDYTIDALQNAKRPVFIVGAGVRLAGAVDDFRNFVERVGIPVLPSWAALDLLPHDHSLFISTFGVYGSRAGNFAIQNADLIIAVGTRLDTRMTGGNIDLFAPGAIKIQCDIDFGELNKRLKLDRAIYLDAKTFLQALNNAISNFSFNDWPFPEWRSQSEWFVKISEWKRHYPIEPQSCSGLHPLTFVKALSDAAPDDALVVFDAGGNLTYCQQMWKVKGAQRVWSAYGFSPMGYSLPAAIGASVATGKPVICCIGDGGMQINIQELQTIKHHHLPVKVFVMDNAAYGIIQQFQEELYSSRYIGTTEQGGYSAPDFCQIARAYGLNDVHVGPGNMSFVEDIVKWGSSVVVDVRVDSSARIQPKVQFGQPLHNQAPFLPEDEIVRVMEVSHADQIQEKGLRYIQVERGQTQV